MIDDFTNSQMFVDCKKYGEMYITDASRISSEHKGYNEASDAVHVFLNFKKVGVFKSKAEANILIQKLIRDCPKQLTKYLEEEKDYIHV